ncbi:MAG: transposase, partial [Flavobacteriales bacterium]
RRSIRLKGYDYAQKGLYFVTIVTQDRRRLFGTIKEGIMYLNAFGIIIFEEWEKTMEIRPNCSLGAFVVMPDHFHAILSIDYSKNKKSDHNKAFKASFKSPSQTLGAIIRGFKGACSKRIKILIKEIEGGKEKGINDGGNPKINVTGVLQYAPSNDHYSPSDDHYLSSDNLYSFNEISILPYHLIKRIDHSKSIWQRNYWEHIIRDQQSFKNISNYIINNPKKWELDKLNNRKK